VWVALYFACGSWIAGLKRGRVGCEGLKEKGQKCHRGIRGRRGGLNWEYDEEEAR
jgi:hypothetical protein